MTKTPTADKTSAQPTSNTETETDKTATAPRSLNLFAVYGICLLLSAVFFFCFGFNSPIHKFNPDVDYQWYMTMGHGLVAGKIPYRDLFEQKGPLVYFVSAFCCLFKNPGIIMLLIEIICLSWFFFFAYRICHKRLNTFYSLIAISILAAAFFTTYCWMYSGAAIEEFCLPILAYFLLCWLEFLLEHRPWNWIRALCLGICFGIMIWSKYTLVGFIIAPMIIWLVISLRQRQYRTVITNLLFMLLGVMMITTPVLIFYGVNHAIGDLFRVYFWINLTAYNTTFSIFTSFANFKTYLSNLLYAFGQFLTIGPLLLFLVLWGIVRFSIQHWRDTAGWLLLITFLTNLALIILTFKLDHYYGQIIPYAIFGIIDLCNWASNRINLPRLYKLTYIIVTALCFIVCVPVSISINHQPESNVPMIVADVIHDYEKTNNTNATLFCYKITDYGFYNAAGIIPNNYFFANNYIQSDRFPQMYTAFQNSIEAQTSDFVITELKTWYAEESFLAQYYAPYTVDVSDSIYYLFDYANIRDVYFILLFKV